MYLVGFLFFFSFNKISFFYFFFSQNAFIFTSTKCLFFLYLKLMLTAQQMVNIKPVIFPHKRCGCQCECTVRLSIEHHSIFRTVYIRYCKEIFITYAIRTLMDPLKIYWSWRGLEIFLNDATFSCVYKLLW